MITTQRLNNGWLFFLPLCPSTNARMRPVRMGSVCREILTSEARNYIYNVSTCLNGWARTNKGFKPICVYTKVQIWTIMTRTNSDCHNFGKIVWDTLEEGGIVTNDKYILPDYRGISFNAQKPEMIVFIPQ